MCMRKLASVTPADLKDTRASPANQANRPRSRADFKESVASNCIKSVFRAFGGRG